MRNKIPLNSVLWKQLEDGCVKLQPGTPELLQQFIENPDIDSDIFHALFDRIFDSNTCLPQFYLVLPYLIDLASQAAPKVTADLWAYIGGWLGEGVQDHKEIPESVLAVYHVWLDSGVNQCLQFICEQDLSACKDLSYVLSAPLSMVHPAFGYVATCNLKHDVGYETTLESTCPHGHLCDYSLDDYRVVNAQGAQGRVCAQAFWNAKIDQLPSLECNPWQALVPKLRCASWHQELYLQIAQRLCQKGISRETPVSLTILLYACLLECFGQGELGNHEIAQRCLHMLNEIACPECGIYFCLADGWQEYDWLLPV